LAVHRRLDLATAAELLGRALRLGEERGEHAALAETHWNFAQMAFYSRDPWQALEHGERALALARELDLDEVIARSANVLSYAHLALAHWTEAVATATEATRRYTALGNQAMAVDSLCLLANGHTCAGAPALAAT